MALNDKHSKNIGDITRFKRWASTAPAGSEYVCPHCGKVIAYKPNKGKVIRLQVSCD